MFCFNLEPKWRNLPDQTRLQISDKGKTVVKKTWGWPWMERICPNIVIKQHTGIFSIKFEISNPIPDRYTCVCIGAGLEKELTETSSFEQYPGKQKNTWGVFYFIQSVKFCQEDINILRRGKD